MEVDILKKVFDAHWDYFVYYCERIIMSRGGGRWLAEEIVQDAFVALWKTKLVDENDARKFLRACCKNDCIDHLRKKKSDREQGRFFIKITEGCDIIELSETEDTLKGFPLEEVIMASETLAPIEKRVFDYMYFHGLSVEQIALVMDISFTYISRHRNLGIKKIQKVLLKRGIIPSIPKTFWKREYKAEEELYLQVQELKSKGLGYRNIAEKFGQNAKLLARNFQHFQRKRAVLPAYRMVYPAKKD
jgi:RNA polymerase sigma factor (sigma-70 family)